jgi:hypothetical protein
VLKLRQENRETQNSRFLERTITTTTTNAQQGYDSSTSISSFALQLTLKFDLVPLNAACTASTMQIAINLTRHHRVQTTGFIVFVGGRRTSETWEGESGILEEREALSVGRRE